MNFYETPIYSKDREKLKHDLTNKISNFYNVKNCHLLTSGSHAIFFILDCLCLYLEKGTFLISKYIYGGTRKKIIPEIKRRYPNITIEFIDIFDELFLQKLSLCDVLFMESCSNPHGYIFNPENFSFFSYIIIDNTWLSPVVFNPFNYKTGKKIVIDSCTKYISGGNCMMGSICYDNNLEKNMISFINNKLDTIGIHISIPYCKTIIDFIDSLEYRIKSSYTRTLDAISYLKNNSKIIELIHPSIHSPELMRDFTYGPSVIFLKLKNYKHEDAYNAGFNIMTSFAHPKDSIDPCIKKDNNGVFIRISFGYSDDSNIYEKLTSFLKD